MGLRAICAPFESPHLIVVPPTPRFFARPLAELITGQGRQILQSTVDLVQGGAINAEVWIVWGGKGRAAEMILNSTHFLHSPCQVIYGDTDSVMIYTGTDDVREARDLGGRIKKEVWMQRTECWKVGNATKMQSVVGFIQWS